MRDASRVAVVTFTSSALAPTREGEVAARHWCRRHVIVLSLARGEGEEEGRARQ